MNNQIHANQVYIEANQELEIILRTIDESAKKFAALYSQCASNRLIEYANILHNTGKWLSEVKK